MNTLTQKNKIIRYYASGFTEPHPKRGINELTEKICFSKNIDPEDTFSAS